MSESEKKKEYDLFTDYNPEHYEVSWDNYKFTGFRTVAEYSAYTKAREDGPTGVPELLTDIDNELKETK